MKSKTIAELFVTTTSNYSRSSKPVYRYKQHSQYVDVSFSSLRSDVEHFAFSLYSLGLKKGETVALISENRYEWIVADFALSCLGIISVPLYTTVTPAQIEFILNDCNASAVIVSNQMQWGKVAKILPNCLNVRHCIALNVLDAEHQLLLSFDELLRTPFIPPNNEDSLHSWFESTSLEVRENDILTLIYTSGTTGEPKGVILSNKNIISNIRSILEVISVTFDDVFLSYLPLAHAYERTTGYYASFASGATTVFAESIETVATNIRETNPTILTSVPRLFDKIRDKMEKAFEKESTSKQKLIQRALSIGLEYFFQSQQDSVSTLLQIKYRLAEQFVLSKLRKKLSPTIRLFVSGGASLSQKSAEFFLGMGYMILEGYGLTESSPVLSVNRPYDIEIGAVGKALHGVEIKLGEDGEILARGENIMIGYHNRPEDTKKTIIDGEWLATGDIGQWTDRGNLKIIDRKKNLIISKGGKNIAPQPIEQKIAELPIVDQIVIIGDNQEYCVALIVPEFSELQSIATELAIEKLPIEQLIEHPAIHQYISKLINLQQKDFSKYERVRKFALLSEPFSIESGELTPKLSIKRSVVEKKYKNKIESLYL
jgi:long-chain acyl-CoA synthetase